jgi:hypothetical protein
LIRLTISSKIYEHPYVARGGPFQESEMMAIRRGHPPSLEATGLVPQNPGLTFQIDIKQVRR